MDNLTQRYYAAHAVEVSDLHDSARPEMETSLRRAFVEGMRVLDIGAGSGRDMRLLQQFGCNVYGVEPCDELRDLTLRRQPELDGRLESGALPSLGLPFGGSFDGVLCSAVLMHLSRAEIIDAAIAIRNVLKDNGRLLVSIPIDRPGLDENSRDRDGRLFTALQPDYFQLLFERIGFLLLDRWESSDSLNREGYSWCTFLMQARHPAGTRPLDLIEGILNRDKKTATYKLALFRALSEIATTSFDQARWLNDGVVGIPIDAVCERWLYYYWPIFESSEFVPQIRGEAPICPKPVAFRSSLTQIIAHYRHRGGLTTFVLDYRGGRLGTDAAVMLRRTQQEIRTTIARGPVIYSGGSLESGRVFDYDGPTREIRMSATIWRELSLVGHWIQDAVILRWAELTSEISRQRLRPSLVVDLLLSVPIPERDVVDARRAYDAARVAVCTWTGRVLRKKYDVDHVLPFSLWHNNDLWNLLPAHPAINAAKSDRLPTRNLMLDRRDRIVDYWDVLREAHTSRFDFEACRVAGVSSLTGNWRSTLFQSVAEAVEFTAAQRGCERWQPA